MNIGILILMIVGGDVGFLSPLYPAPRPPPPPPPDCAQLSDHDYLENLSQNPSWI